MMIDRKITRIACGNDAARGVMSKQERRIGDRDAERFQMAGRDSDDETPNFTEAASLELMRDGLDVKVVLVLRTRVDDPKGSLNEACQLIPLGGIQNLAQMPRIVVLLPEAGPLLAHGLAPTRLCALLPAFGAGRGFWRAIKFSRMARSSSLIRSPSLSSAEISSTRTIKLRRMFIALASPLIALAARLLSSARCFESFLGLPPSLTLIRSESSSIRSVLRFLVPLGRPLGFPERPGLNRVCCGGLP